MKTNKTHNRAQLSRHAFTLPELIIAMGVGLALSGTALVLQLITAQEERNGFSDTTVEEKAYTLEANITGCLRGMSASMGITPVWSTALYDTSGNLLGYQSISVFFPTNGGYTTANINFNSTTGQVTYNPNTASSTGQVIWMSNTPSAVLTELCFNTSQNLDISPDSSLVRVLFEMNDNGYSQQNPSNNMSSVYRNFSVQMRNDD
ncbi:MAG TPA: hypothetical protein VGN61_07770 [Verrucomicrobiae bacterium]